MPMPTLQQIIGTITGKVAFERTQANFTTIKDAHNSLETTVNSKANSSTVTTLQQEVTSHKAEYTTQIANRIKKDGDTTGGIFFDAQAGIGSVRGIYIVFGADTTGAIIKTNIPFVAYGTFVLNIIINKGDSGGLFHLMVRVRSGGTIENGFISLKALSHTSFKPELKVFYLDGKICLRIDTNLNYLTLDMSVHNISPIAPNRLKYEHFTNWSAVSGAVPVDAQSAAIISYEV